MTLSRLATVGREVKLATVESLDGDFQELLQVALRGSQSAAIDPMDHALAEAGAQFAPTELHGREALNEYPLTSQCPAVIWTGRDATTAGWLSCCKGAPETVMTLCRVDNSQRAQLRRRMTSMASHGLRVLAVARAVTPTAPLDPRAIPLEFMGLIAFIDPLRTEVPDAVAECRSAGLRVVMITGDYPVATAAIAREAGLPQPDTVITGAKLDQLDEPTLHRRIGHTHVFAHIRPDQKLRLVNAFKAAGEVVAMTGDGVNDAPALKAADIGIAMGRRGTDVAREAAELVLLDDAFSSIVTAVRLGRRIYDNIRKSSVVILAVHVLIAGLSMIPVLMGNWPLLLLPVHIVFMEFIIDPACALAFESERAESEVIRRPPRPPEERLFSIPMVMIGLLQRLAVLVGCLTVFLWGHQLEPRIPIDQLRALTFAALVAAVLTLIVVNRSWGEPALSVLRESNTAFLAVTLLSSSLLGAALVLPVVGGLFSFEPVLVWPLVWALAMGVGSALWFEAFKKYLHRRLTS